jgi:hypothetical protein
MRGLFAAILVVGCYAPKAPTGAPCAGNDCPAGLVCSPATHTCEVSAVDAFVPMDAAPVDVDTSVFKYRRRITIHNTATSALPTGFTIRVSVGSSLASLLGMGKVKADFSDLRVIGDGSLGERDRIIDPPTGPAPPGISFSLVLPIPAGATSTDYALYYGAPDAAAAPANGAAVFPVYDDFATSVATFWLKNDGPTVQNGQLLLRAAHTDAVLSPAASVPIVSAFELVASVSNPQSDPTVQPSGTFYYWFGYQKDFSAVDPWVLWIARGKGGVQGEQKSPVGCEAGCEQPTPNSQNTLPHYYAIERDPTVTRFYLDGTLAYMTPVTNQDDYPVILRNFMATGDLHVDYARARARVAPDPMVMVGAEENL